jgi:hypothetical protein
VEDDTSDEVEQDEVNVESPEEEIAPTEDMGVQPDTVDCIGDHEDMDTDQVLFIYIVR